MNTTTNFSGRPSVHSRRKKREFFSRSWRSTLVVSKSKGNLLMGSLSSTGMNRAAPSSPPSLLLASSSARVKPLLVRAPGASAPFFKTLKGLRTATCNDEDEDEEDEEEKVLGAGVEVGTGVGVGVEGLALRGSLERSPPEQRRLVYQGDCLKRSQTREGYLALRWSRAEALTRPPLWSMKALTSLWILLRVSAFPDIFFRGFKGLFAV